MPLCVKERGVHGVGSVVGDHERERHTQTQEAGTVVRGRNSGRWGRSSGCGGGASLADGTCGQSPMSNAARDDSHTHSLTHTLTLTQCTRITELTACSTGEGKGGAYQVGAYEVGWRLEQMGLERMGVPLEELLLLVLA